jgi:hypothetical protein
MLEQTLDIIILVKLEKNATEICKMLQKVYGEGTVSRTQIICGLSNFKVEEKSYR